MKKLMTFLVVMICLQTMAQRTSPIRIRNADPEFEAATKSILEKMKEVFSYANGFKDALPVKTKSYYGTVGYFQNTNAANGVIFYNAASKISYFIGAGTRLKYASMTAEGSTLGLPASDLKNVRSGVDKNFGIYVTFENGAICTPPGKPAIAIVSPVYGKYNNMGGPASRLGWPTMEWSSFVGRANEYYQLFQGGAFWGNKNTAYSIYGAVAKKFNKSIHGMPLEDEKGNSVMNMATQKFEKGTIVYGTKTGAWFVQGGILQKWYDLGGGGVNNTTGLPTSEQVVNGSMIAQNFEKGLMLSVNGKVTFVPDDNEKNKTENNKIRETIRIPGKQ